MFENTPLSPEQEDVLLELIRLTRKLKRKRFFMELNGNWFSMYNSQLVGEGETLLHSHIDTFQELRKRGFVAFNLNKPAYSNMFRYQLDITSKAIENCKNKIIQQDPLVAGGTPVLQMPEQRIVSILFLSADPTNASRLRLGEELREIQEKLQLARLRDKFMLEQRMSVRSSDISQALLDIQPHIVHFSGHGTSRGELCFENQMGEMHRIQPDALAALFEQFANQVKCVVLNACYSEMQANAIVKHIEYVVGMNQTIGDRAAIAFSIGFYQALGAGRTIEEAYKLGVAQIRLQGVPEHLTPVLNKKE